MRSHQKALMWLHLLLVAGSFNYCGLACFCLKNNESARLCLVSIEGSYKLMSASLEKLFIVLYYLRSSLFWDVNET